MIFIEILILNFNKDHHTLLFSRGSGPEFEVKTRTGFLHFSTMSLLRNQNRSRTIENRCGGFINIVNESEHGLEANQKSLLYILVLLVYVKICAPSRLVNVLHFLHNKAIIQSQCYTKISQPQHWNINNPATKDLWTFMYTSCNIKQSH